MEGKVIRHMGVKIAVENCWVARVVEAGSGDSRRENSLRSSRSRMLTGLPFDFAQGRLSTAVVLRFAKHNLRFRIQVVRAATRVISL